MQQLLEKRYSTNYNRKELYQQIIHHSNECSSSKKTRLITCLGAILYYSFQKIVTNRSYFDNQLHHRVEFQAKQRECCIPRARPIKEMVRANFIIYCYVVSIGSFGNKIPNSVGRCPYLEPHISTISLFPFFLLYLQPREALLNSHGSLYLFLFL